ncbi:MAG: hypothetical protein HY275_03900, partial [Gemmatimonadetes bacterium]|nr:hypothetical protein [Gemmatimonadota bacterium]
MLCEQEGVVGRVGRGLGRFRGAPVVLGRLGGRIARALRRTQVVLQLHQFCAPLERPRAAGGAGQPDRAALVHEGGAAIDRLHGAEEGARPVPHRVRDAHLRAKGAGVVVSAGHRIERQQEQRARVGLRVPAAHLFGRRTVAHHDGVHRGAEEPLDERRGAAVGR